MAQDARRITLTSGELVSAFESYRKIVPNFLPEGKIIHCAPSNFGSVTVTLEQRNGDAIHESHFMFDAEDIMPLIINFCIQSRIMLPRLGQKSVEVSDEAVVLCVQMSIDLEPGDVVFFDVNEIGNRRIKVAGG
jgi:hypothetical protein